MIGRLWGKVIAKQPPQLILKVDGVGYEVQASMQTFYQLPSSESDVTLYTHLIVREDSHTLYGFIDNKERQLFRTLIKINGIGPKLALTILSSIQPEQFIRCVHVGDAASLVKLPGVGKRTAERLIVEMRDRVGDMEFDTALVPEKGVNEVNAAECHVQDAISALVSLGYKPQDASRAISRLSQKDQSSEALIRAALNVLAG